MIPILDNEVDDFCDVASMIEGHSHIVARDGLTGDIGCTSSWT